jgi:hypothetical protein
MLRDSRRYLILLHPPLHQFLQRRRLAIRDPARHDQIEKAQIRRNVVGESVRGHPAADVHADGGELFLRTALSHPNPCFPSDAFGRNSKLSRGPDHRLFQHAHIPHHVAPDCAQIQDRVSHNLPRPMIRNIAAAVRGMKLYALLLQDVFRSQQILAFPTAPLRNHVWMLAEQQHILDRPGFPRRHHALLQRPRLRVANQSQVDNVADFHQSRAASHYTLICNPRTLANASPMPSQTVG